MSQDTTIYLAIDVTGFQKGFKPPSLFHHAPEPGAFRFQRLFVSVIKHAISQM